MIKVQISAKRMGSDMGAEDTISQIIATIAMKYCNFQCYFLRARVICEVHQ